VGNAFALSKRSGISTALAAAAMASIPTRQTSMGIRLHMDGSKNLAKFEHF
jgi:hypothetical protein